MTWGSDSPWSFGDHFLGGSAPPDPPGPLRGQNQSNNIKNQSKNIKICEILFYYLFVTFLFLLIAEQIIAIEQIIAEQIVANLNLHFFEKTAGAKKRLDETLRSHHRLVKFMGKIMVPRSENGK